MLNGYLALYRESLPLRLGEGVFATYRYLSHQPISHIKHIYPDKPLFVLIEATKTFV
jgi:hypothetical protein